MKRLVFETMLEWKASKNHKVLLLRGARQVGKTYIARELGKTFKSFVEVNFEKDADVKQFFDQNYDPERISASLSAYYGNPIIDGETLLFFDEIQSCSKAIQALRFFYEARPGLHVIAAGSLLEFALADLPSWGVGRIRSLFMHPMSFDEFLLANNRESLLDLKKNASPENPLNSAFHNMLIDYLKKFLIIGGMPETVKTYTENQSDITAVQKVLSDITISYYDDFAKYKNRSPLLRLREVLSSVVKQAGGKYIYSKTGTLSNPSQAKEALDLLEMAGLVHKVYHSSGQGIPLGAETNYKKFKALLLDTGIFQQSVGFKVSDYLLAKNIDMLNRGNIAEIFTGLEMIKYADAHEKRQLYYWHREKRGSNAEIDYLIEHEGNVVPVEVKSGSSGKMQSLNLFLNERDAPKGIRISLENFSAYDKIEVVPLYAISNLYN
ncbi:MAG: ATP-binding protein [Cyclobacteriaceae bacterium]|nr:ATP-binding protein [Cyclobacteriaceae bacterium]